MTDTQKCPMQPGQKPKPFGIPTLSVLLCFSLAAFATGCGTMASITRKGAPPIAGRITGSDTSNVYLNTFKGGGVEGVSRDNIEDIDHPGNVAATIGSILTAYGVLNIFAGASDCDTRGAVYCTGVFLPAAIGAPLLIYGATVWSKSVAAASKTSNMTMSRVTVVPITSLGKKDQVFGATARISF